MTDSEVSKIGHPDNHYDDEVIEGRIVGEFEGPGGFWTLINEQVWNMYRRQAEEREASTHYIVDADRIEFVRAPESYIPASGGWSTPKGQHYDLGWLDEAYGMEPVQSVSVEFTWDEVSDEAFRLMTGWDKNVLHATRHMDEVPGVDIGRVKWPGK